ncbi:phage tail tape measure protein [Plastoroseomonas hellenica]|uniref:phage tail tape measure protein n=1 Tax=Plastoroseomonas hellenica TaxID=2687306 RepID=UPI001BA452DF|nr:phage tail tape measure protein [Plastoroseomonas hellenica]MBR0643985.1 phage tail tape measure protein [Plastoroseomonas hellenica]
MSGSTRDMRARLVLSLRDGTGSGLNQVTGRLARIRQALDRLANVTAIGAGLNFLGPMQQAAQFEDMIRQTAITAGLSGRELERYITETRAAYERMAVAVGQRSRDLAQAGSTLVAAGFDRGQVLQAVELIGRVGTAAGANLDELAQTYFQLGRQMGISLDEMPRAFAALMQGARDGNFELRDMAREFPAILAAARALRVQGLGGVASLTAMLEMAKTVSGSSSEAANNVLNALQKLAAPETVRQFREIGVNIEGVMDDAVRRGINPVEAIIQKLRERTGGNLFRLQELFGDRQALMGLLPLLQETARYLETRNNAANASTALIDDAFEDRMRGIHQSMVLVQERAEQLSRRFQLAFGPALVTVIGVLTSLQDAIGFLDRDFPGLVDGSISLGTSILLLLTGFSFLARGVMFVVGGLRPLASLFGVLATVVGGTAAAVIGAVAGIAIAAFLIWRNWDQVGPWFRRLMEILRGLVRSFAAWVVSWAPGAFRAAVGAIQAVWGVLRVWFGTLWRTWVTGPFNTFTTWVDGWTDGAMSAGIARLQRLWESPRDFINETWEGAQRRLTEFVSWVDGWTGGAMTAAIDRFKAVWDALRPFFEALWNGIKATFNFVFGPIIALIERIDAMISRNRSEAVSETGAVNDPEAQAARRRNQAAGGARRIDDAEWNAPEAAVPAAGRDGRVEVTVRAEPGTEITDARATGGPATVTTPDRGTTRGRP